MLAWPELELFEDWEIFMSNEVTHEIEQFDGSELVLRVQIDIKDDEQMNALHAFMRATPAGRARMLVAAETEGRRESGIVLNAEG